MVAILDNELYFIRSRYNIGELVSSTVVGLCSLNNAAAGVIEVDSDRTFKTTLVGILDAICESIFPYQTFNRGEHVHTGVCSVTVLARLKDNWIAHVRVRVKYRILSTWRKQIFGRRGHDDTIVSIRW